MFDKVIISLSLALVTLTSPDHVTNKVGPRKQYFAQFKRPYDGSETGLDPRIGHGISPNFSPRYSPPVQTEHMPDIKDFLSFEGRLQNHLLTSEVIKALVPHFLFLCLQLLSMGRI